jgi:hypothetical protein
MAAAATTFNTIQYCIDNTIPCFTLGIGWNRETSKKALYFPIEWQKIETPLIKEGVNGFAIITGKSIWVIDFDNCFERLPEVTQKLFRESCGTIVKTSRGFHFYFLINSETETFNSPTKISIEGKRYLEDGGIDIRAKKGCIIAPPTTYKADGEERKYEWIKGDLSTIREAPKEILNLIDLNEVKECDSYSVITSDPNNVVAEDINEPEQLPPEKWDEVIKLVDMLCFTNHQR